MWAHEVKSDASETALSCFCVMFALRIVVIFPRAMVLGKAVESRQKQNGKCMC